MKQILIVIATAVLAGCAPETPPASNAEPETRSDPPAPRFQADIRRSSYGVAHISASNLAGLGFGEGYAQAEDHLCTIADQVIKVRSQRARYFGAGENNEHLLRDAGLLALGLYERASRDLEGMEIREQLEGFAAGYNRYLAETGAENVPGWCQGAEWITPISAEDIAAYMRAIVVSSSNFAHMMAAAQPPEPNGESADSAYREQALDRLELAALGIAQGLGRNGSNGWGLGADWAESGSGMLLANPHYPWVGSNRFWEKHLQIPGEMDVYGVSLIGAPGVALGFNENVAWTQTVSAGRRFTLYALELLPGEPTRYLFDGEPRDLEARTVTVEVLQDDGTRESVEHTVYFSHLGPLMNFPQLEWTTERAIAIRDANADNDEAFALWNALSQASGSEEFKAAHARYQGMPWTNTISAFSDGTAWYTDSAATPYLSAEALAEWNSMKESNPEIEALWQQGLVLLPGNDSQFDWGAHPAARDAGVIPFEQAPQLSRSDYVFNANDSFWLANSAAPIEGDFSPLQGTQRTVRSLRTRNNDLTLSHRSPDLPAGENRKFSLDEMKAALFSNRAYGAELLKPELLAACRSNPVVTVDEVETDLTAACDVLEAWNNRFDNDSRGAPLFREWTAQYPFPALMGKGPLYANDFDPADPVNTPSGIGDPELALQNLARATRVLESAGHALDVPLGQLQFALAKLPHRIPIHGGNGSYEGNMNMQVNSRNTTTLEPFDYPELVEGSTMLTESGYPIVHGSSFIMVLEFTDSGPRAEAILSYSQSGDPNSKHFIDQTELYSNKIWRPVLYREADIEANVQRRYSLTSEN